MLHILPLRYDMTARKSFVGVATECAKHIGPSELLKSVIVKIQNRDDRRITNELEILKALSEFNIPGVVRLADFPMQDVDLAPFGSPRVRSALVLASVGRPLSTCDSFCEFLEVIFDLVETHRQMLKSGMLHRDPSWGNVLIGPRDESTEDYRSWPMVHREHPCCRYGVSTLHLIFLSTTYHLL